MEKKYDILIIGATGFVGRRYTRELIEFLQKSGRTALATARNEQKLEQLKEALPACQQLGFGRLDISRLEQVKEAVAQVSLVVNFAGPFDIYGGNVVGACAEFGVHYLDITGEVQFGRRMAKEYHEMAKANGAVIVPFAAFDSVPSDLGVFMAAKALAEKGQGPCQSVEIVYRAKGGVNGGTIASAIDINKKVTSRDMSNRNYYLPDVTDSYVDAPQEGVRFQAELGLWVGPFFMEPINSKVVYRSVTLNKDNKKLYCPDFAYRESHYLGKKLSKLKATATVSTLKFTESLLKREWGRNLVKKFATAQGDGPSEKTIENGFFQSDIFGRSKNGTKVHLRMKSDGDPGNKSTVKLIMACTEAVLDGKFKNSGGGVLTPSLAFGADLIPYLERNEVYLNEITAPA